MKTLARSKAIVCVAFERSAPGMHKLFALPAALRLFS